MPEEHVLKSLQLHLGNGRCRSALLFHLMDWLWWRVDWCDKRRLLLMFSSFPTEQRRVAVWCSAAVACHHVCSRALICRSTLSSSTLFQPRLDPWDEPCSQCCIKTHLFSYVRACVGVGASHPSLCDLSPCFHILSHVGSPLRCGEHSCWLLSLERLHPHSFHPPTRAQLPISRSLFAALESTNFPNEKKSLHFELKRAVWNKMGKCS